MSKGKGMMFLAGLLGFIGVGSAAGDAEAKDLADMNSEEVAQALEERIDRQSFGLLDAQRVDADHDGQKDELRVTLRANNEKSIDHGDYKTLFSKFVQKYRSQGWYQVTFHDFLSAIGVPTHLQNNLVYDHLEPQFAKYAGEKIKSQKKYALLRAKKVSDKQRAKVDGLRSQYADEVRDATRYFADVVKPNIRADSHSLYWAEVEHATPSSQTEKRNYRLIGDFMKKHAVAKGIRHEGSDSFGKSKKAWHIVWNKDNQLLLPSEVINSAVRSGKSPLGQYVVEGLESLALGVDFMLGHTEMPGTFNGARLTLDYNHQFAESPWEVGFRLKLPLYGMTHKDNTQHLMDRNVGNYVSRHKLHTEKDLLSADFILTGTYNIKLGDVSKLKLGLGLGFGLDDGVRKQKYEMIALDDGAETNFRETEDFDPERVTAGNTVLEAMIGYEHELENDIIRALSVKLFGGYRGNFVPDQRNAGTAGAALELKWK